MARKQQRSTYQDALNAFSQTYSMAKGVLQDKEMADIAKATPETDTGYTKEQGDHINAIANAKDENGNPYYTVTPGENGNYQVQANFGNNDVAQIQQGTRTTFLGNTTAGTMNEAQLDKARLMAMSGVKAKYGDPMAALQLKQAARQGELTDLQIKGAERQERDAQREEEYKAGIPNLFSQSRYSQLQGQFEQDNAAYNQKKAEYDNSIAQGADPKTLGLPPVAPKRPTYSPADALHDTALGLDYDARFQKYNPQKWQAFAMNLDKVQNESYEKAMNALHSGNVDKALTEFNKDGEHHLEKSDIVSVKPVEAVIDGAKVKTNQITYRNPDGSTTTLNAANELNGIGKAQEIFNRNMKVRDEGRADAHLGLAQKQDQREQERFDAAAPARQVAQQLGTAQLALANEKDPAVRKDIQGTITDLSTASGKNAPHVSKVISNDKGELVMVMSNGGQKPLTDANGSPIKKDDKGAEIALAKHMTMQGAGQDQMAQGMKSAHELLHGPTDDGSMPWQRYGKR